MNITKTSLALSLAWALGTSALAQQQPFESPDVASEWVYKVLTDVAGKQAATTPADRPGSAR